MSGLMMKYFVLKPHGTDAYARASRAAMVRYATFITDTNPELADALYKWANEEGEAAEANGNEGDA